MIAVLFYFGCVAVVVSFSLAGPIFVSLLAGEVDLAQRLFVHMLLAVFVFGGLVLALAGRQKRLNQFGRLALMALVWTMMPMAAAIPIADVSQLSYFDSLFESISGLTTAGASVLKTLETWPQGLIFWRIQLQWIGGFLALLTIVLIVAPLGIGGLTSNSGVLFRGDRSSGAGRRAITIVMRLGIIYLTMTGLCALLFLLSGGRAFYAVTLAMTAVSTGGFLPFDAPLDTILPLGGVFIFAVFLLLGATSVFWHRMLVDGRFAQLARHRESYSVIALVALLTLVYTFKVAALGSSSETPGAALIEGFFTATSLVSTSGIETRPGVIALLPLIIILFIILAGGSAYSTSGGLKHYRIGGMLVQSWNEIERLIYPNAVRSSKFGSQEYDLGLMKAIWSFFVVTVFTIAIGTVWIASTDVPFEAALTSTIAAFTTAGPIYGSQWGESWPHFGDFSTFAKISLMLSMVLGRLEVLALLGLFSARYWRS